MNSNLGIIEPAIDDGLILTSERLELEKSFLAFRDALLKVNRLSVAGRAIEKLHEIYQKPIQENLLYLPWELLLLVKWSFGYHLKADSRIVKLDDSHFDHLLRLFREITGYGLPIRSDDNALFKNLRVIAYQQFWLQRAVTVGSVGRSLILFSKLKCDFSIKENFKEKTGLEIDHFFELVWALVSRWHSQNSTVAIEKTYLDVFKETYPPGTIEAFFRLISLPLSEAMQLCRDDFARFPLTQQVFEQTPLIRYPMVEVGNQYWTYSPILMMEMQRSLPITLLTELFGRSFSEKFGDTFTSYVELGLNYSKQTCFTERDLKNVLKKDGAKVVDFVISHPDCTILIEAKATRVPRHLALNPTDQKMARTLKSSITKAYCQFYEMVEFIRNGQLKDLGITEHRNVFCLLVTYDEMYALDGRVVWSEFAGDAVRPYLQSKTLDETLIDQGKVFFLSITAFDKLMEVVGSGKGELFSILKQATQDNQQQDDSRLSFEQHVDQYKPLEKSLPYLATEASEIFQRVVAKFPSSERTIEKLALAKDSAKEKMSFQLPSDIHKEDPLKGGAS